MSSSNPPPDVRDSQPSKWLLGLKHALILGLLVLGWYILDHSGIVDFFMRSEGVEEAVKALGAGGPLLIIFGIAVAVVITPLPSAPVALAAGALYGMYWGTFYIVLGAQLGATIAFLVARHFRNGILRPFVAKAETLPLLGSENVLTATVLVSRILPFLSFDLISYAAGLSILGFKRFFIATLIGIVPMSFLLAHLGMSVREIDGAGVAITLAIVVAMVVAGYMIKRILAARRS